MSGAAGDLPGRDSGGVVGVDRFLTPEAMLTPGAAGGITMVIANGLANNFGFEAAYIGLALSFLFGFLVIATARKWWLQGIYYVLNSLVIFCVAFGSTNLVAGGATQPHAESALHLIAPAFAEESPTAPGAGTAQAPGAQAAPAPLQKDHAAGPDNRNGANAGTPQQATSFFNAWRSPFR